MLPLTVMPTLISAPTLAYEDDADDASERRALPLPAPCMCAQPSHRRILRHPTVFDPRWVGPRRRKARRVSSSPSGWTWTLPPRSPLCRTDRTPPPRRLRRRSRRRSSACAGLRRRSCSTARTCRCATGGPPCARCAVLRAAASSRATSSARSSCTWPRRVPSRARRGHVWFERPRRVAVRAAEAVQGLRCGGALVLAGMSHAVMEGLERVESALLHAWWP
jgi:hypothetical protein